MLYPLVERGGMDAHDRNAVLRGFFATACVGLPGATCSAGNSYDQTVGDTTAVTRMPGGVRGATSRGVPLLSRPTLTAR